MTRVHIRETRTAAEVITPHGEIVHELGGISAGGLNKHSVAHITLLPGKSSLKHYHPRVEESYYILAGTGKMVIEDGTFSLVEGQMIAIPCGQTHQILNTSTAAPLIFIAVCVPPWTPDCSVFVAD